MPKPLRVTVNTVSKQDNRIPRANRGARSPAEASRNKSRPKVGARTESKAAVGNPQRAVAARALESRRRQRSLRPRAWAWAILGSSTRDRAPMAAMGRESRGRVMPFNIPKA